MKLPGDSDLPGPCDVDVGGGDGAKDDGGGRGSSSVCPTGLNSVPGGMVPNNLMMSLMVDGGTRGLVVVVSYWTWNR